jgi:hypothetical protein
VALPPLAADASSIVITGAFKPVEITPAWMLENNLISAADAHSAQFELLIPGEAVTFTGGWFKCQINPQSFQLETSEESEFERLRDLAVNTLRVISARPVSQMGMNRAAHISISDLASWHAIGDHLVNNKMWDKVLHLAGMRAVSFWGVRTDGYGGRINVQIEPSMRFPPGLFILLNDHYDLTAGKTWPTTREEFATTPSEDTEATIEKISVAIQILNDNWTASTRLFYDVLETVWQQGQVSDA